MLTTVVIPVLNRADLLKRCIDSIDYEIDTLIIVNNGQETVPAFFNNFIKKSYILYMPSNLGVATSWNLGIKSTPYSHGWLLPLHHLGAAKADLLSLVGLLAPTLLSQCRPTSAAPFCVWYLR